MTSEAVRKYNEVIQRRRRHLREFLLHGGLILLMLIYSFIGGALFQSLEEKNEQQVKADLIKEKHELIEKIWVGNGDARVNKVNWTNMVDRLLGYYVEELAIAVSHGIDITDVTQHTYNSTQKWDFWGSVFFAGTVYTTVGYGHIAPVTPAGKIATICYGMIGIPLCLILLADLGNILSKVIKAGLRSLKRLFYNCKSQDLCNRWPPSDDIESLSGWSVFVCLCFIIVLYLFAGAAMYRLWEDEWSYLDAFYFIFVSTSTIGFGDVMPNHPNYFLISSIYIFFGLSLISTGFTVLQEILQSKIEEATKTLDKTLETDKEFMPESMTVSSQLDSDSNRSHDLTEPTMKVINLDDNIMTVEATIVLPS